MEISFRSAYFSQERATSAWFSEILPCLLGLKKNHLDNAYAQEIHFGVASYAPLHVLHQHVCHKARPIFPLPTLPCTCLAPPKIRPSKLIFTPVRSFSCLIIPLDHRWQTLGPQAQSSPPPCFTLPGTLFLPGGSAELPAPS